MTEVDFQEIYDFLKMRHAEEADTIQMRATRFAVLQVLEIANDELEMVDENDVIDRCAEILKAFAQPYRSWSSFRPEWYLELGP
jgi:hypothetical protein